MLPLIIFVAFMLVTGFFLWLRKLVLKKRLRAGLGREVSDRELTSLTAWMKAADKKDMGTP